MTRRRQRDAVEQIEWMRNLLAFMLVGMFVGAIPLFVFKVIPKDNEQLITYMVGQLSGMAIMALGFYFVDKVGQAALDAKRVDNTSKMLETLQTVSSSDSPQDAKDAADQVATAAEDKRDEIVGNGPRPHTPD